jgi:tellurite resistance protein TerA
MITFGRGQKGKLADLGLGSNVAVNVALQAPGATIDLSCFGLDAQGKLSDDRYMVFYNQLASPEGAVRLTLAPGAAAFQLNLDALPATIDRLVFTGALDGGGTMRAIAPGSLSVGGAATFPLSGADFADEKAVILGEIYRRDGSWRFGAVGQGFNGGMAALLEHFGGTEAAASAPAPAPVAAPAPAPAPKISLSKITLEKRGDKISLEKGAGRGFGKIRVNLNWNQRPQEQPAKTGFFAKLTGGAQPKGIDLDLACLFEMRDGSPGGVQALGESWGAYDRPPYIHLAGDDRSGAVSDGENIFINGDRFDEIGRVLIFSFIYEGVPNWAATDGVVLIEVPNQPPVEVRLDHGGAQQMCAIAMIENQGGKLQVTKLVDYVSGDGKISGHEVIGTKYGFKLRWRAGSKN